MIVLVLLNIRAGIEAVGVTGEVSVEARYCLLYTSTEDWKYRDADHVKKAIVEQAQDGDVVLMHDLYETSVQGVLACLLYTSAAGAGRRI